MAVSISIASMHFIVMILFLSCYNVSLRFFCASFFGVNVVTWHSKYILERKEALKFLLLFFSVSFAVFCCNANSKS